RAVQFNRDVVSGAMGKKLAKARVANHLASSIVRLIAMQHPARIHALLGESLLNTGDSSVARIPHRIENLLLQRGRLAPDDSRPGDVVVNAVGRVLAAPDVDQQEVA